MIRLLAGVTLLLLLAPARADAAWWDWIKELSGPGPSQSKFSVIGTICTSDIAKDKDVAIQEKNRTTLKKPPCLFVDFRPFDNKSDDNFPNNVQIQAWDFGVTWKLFDQRVEVGAGGGLMRFASDDHITNSGEKVTHTSGTLTIPRIVVVPLRFLPCTKARAWRILKFYIRENVILGTIDAMTFGVPSGSGAGASTFRAKNDPVFSYGFLLDFVELLGR